MTLQRQSATLTVIGGFLGAGKTTLLNSWLRAAQGEHIAVLVNDFGELNIDAELIASVNGNVIGLSNGCVCCQIGDDLSRALMQVMAADIPFDAIVVEASGVSDPWRIAQLALAEPELSLGGVIVLVDAAAFLGHLADPLLTDTMERQLRAADLIIVNKTDLVSTETLMCVHARIRVTAPKTQCLDSVQGHVPVALLRSPALPLEPMPAVHPLDSCGMACDHELSTHGRVTINPEHGDLFQTWSARPTHVFETHALRSWIADPPEGLLRLKALLLTGDGEWSELQFAGRHGSLRRTEVPGAGSGVVAIGLPGRLPLGALNSQFGTPVVSIANDTPDIHS